MLWCEFGTWRVSRVLMEVNALAELNIQAMYFATETVLH